MITEFINGLNHLQPLIDPSNIKVGRILCMEYNDHRDIPVRWFYKVVAPVGDPSEGDWQFETIRIQMSDGQITKDSTPTYRFGSFISITDSYGWYWFEHYPELKYDPNQQGDTDEDI